MQIAINNLGEPRVCYTLTKLSELCFTLQSSEAWRIEGFLDRFHGIAASIFTPIRAILLFALWGGYEEGEGGISQAETRPKNLCAGQGRGSEGIRVISDN